MCSTPLGLPTYVLRCRVNARMPSAVIVPAHNEESVLGTTIAALLEGLDDDPVARPDEPGADRLRPVGSILGEHAEPGIERAPPHDRLGLDVDDRGKDLADHADRRG